MTVEDTSSCCDSAAAYRVDAVVSIDERGQMVLPKDVRQRAGLNPGDKLALITWEKNGEVCCMSLVKASSLNSMVRDYLEPIMQGAPAE